MFRLCQYHVLFCNNNNFWKMCIEKDFLIASMQCVNDLKKDFVVVVVVLDAKLLSKFPQNWIMFRLEKIMQYGSFIPDYS